MSRTGRNLKRTLPSLALLLTLPWARHVGAQQSGAQAGNEAKFLETRVPEFVVHGETLLDGTWKLARGPAPFRFGFEKILKKKFTDPEIAGPRFDLHLKDKTVREILDALCEADPRFAWSMDGATVNVFPRSVIGDDHYLLNRGMGSLELNNAVDIQDGLLAIVHQLPPPVEQVAISQIGGGDPYPPEPWTVTFKSMKVRQVMNRLTEHGGPCAIWIFGGSEDFRAFGFFNTDLCSPPPPPPSWAPKRVESPPKGL